MADEFQEGLGGLEAGPETTGTESAERGPAADPSSHPTVPALRETFGDAILHHEIQSGDEHVVFIRADRNVEILGWLKEEHRFDLLKDVTGVDYGGGRPLQVVYELWSIPEKRQLRLKAELPLDALEIETVVPLWSGADWLEREVYDMFGIQFTGHPDLRRILMPDNYSEGHPLRKDFPLRGRFSRAEQTRRSMSFDLEDHYTPSELDILKPRDWERTKEKAARRGMAGSTEFPENRSDSRDARDATEEQS